MTTSALGAKKHEHVQSVVICFAKTVSLISTNLKTVTANLFVNTALRNISVRIQKMPKTDTRKKIKIGAYIKRGREKAGLTQEQLAKALGVSQSRISACESGTRGFKATEYVLATELFKRRDLQ